MRKGERFAVGEETIWRASLARVGVGYGEIEEGGGGRLRVESRNCQSRAWLGMTACSGEKGRGGEREKGEKEKS